MKDIDYATAVARVRVNETTMLTPADIDRLLGAKSLDEAVSLLTDKGFSKQGDDISHIFDGKTESAWQLIREIAPDKNEFDFLLIKNDFHNLKAILKGIVTDKDYSSLLLYPTVIPIETLETAVKEQKFSLLPPYMSEVAKQAYSFFVNTLDGQLSDLCIDKGSLEAVIALSENNDNRFIKDLGELIAATYNLRIAVRATKNGQSKDMLEEALCDCKSISKSSIVTACGEGFEALCDYIKNTSYGEAGEMLSKSVSDFEKWCDNSLISFVSSARYSSFGAAPLAAYIIKNEAQLKTVRIIISGKMSGLNDSVIKQRIREVY